jgi:NRAMP (natural resistance-associated macrophage protein)-like metal ion transporter
MFKKVKKFWKSLGPGIVTGASDDDPSGIATYSQAGAKFGLSTLWTAWLTLPLMIAVLEMFARITLVTSQGLAKNLKKFYPKWFLYLVIGLNLPAIILNIGADILGMGAVLQLLFPEIPRVIFTAFITISLISSLIYFSYEKMAAILKWLCLILIVYFIVPFIVKEDWNEVFFATIVPQIRWNREYLFILVAIIGTTISPYLFFWQSTMSLEHQNHQDQKKSEKKEKEEMQTDVVIGMSLSNIVMYFIILTTAAVLYPAGINNIETVEQAAKALEPLAGESAYLLFTLGIIGTGFLAVPVLAGSIAYFISDTFEWHGDMDKRWHQAKGFYSIIIISIFLGFLFTIFDIDPVKWLIFTAVVYGFLCPVFIGMILHMCNNKNIMGTHVNGWLSNIFGGFSLFVTSGAAIALLYLTLME